MNTAFGQIADRLSLRPPETEFERGIKQLGYLLTEVMLLLVLGIFAFNVYFQKPVLDSLLFSIRTGGRVNTAAAACHHQYQPKQYVI